MTLWGKVMKKAAVVSAKGGVGKTTIALHLMILACLAGTRAAIYDADDGESSLEWGRTRERSFGSLSPIYAHPVDDVDLLIVDTPPNSYTELPRLLSGSDLVLIPTRPGGLDLKLTRRTIDMVRQLGLPMAVVLSLPAPRMPEIEEASKWLKAEGVPIAGLIHHRVDIGRAGLQGKALHELDSTSKGCEEFVRVYEYMCNIIK
jgi:chromosome partitioning protein